MHLVDEEHVAGRGHEVEGRADEPVSCVSVPPTSAPRASPGLMTSSPGIVNSPSGVVVRLARKVTGWYAAGPCPRRRSIIDMHRRQAHGAAEERVHRGDVAVADERGSGVPDRRDVQPLQRLHAAVATADREDGVDIGPRQRVLQLRRPGHHGPRQKRLPLEDAVVPDGFEAQAPQLGDPWLDLVVRRRTGRRTRAMRLPGPTGRNFV